MTVKRRDLAEAVLQIIEQSKTPETAAQSVAAYLIDERRTKELQALLRDLEELQLQRRDRLEVTATSATVLGEDAKQKIRQLFDAKNVIIHEEVNKNLLGGVHVRALDKVADFSVQARLRQLRQGRSL